MGKTFEQGKDEVAKLCKYFETNHRKYLEAAGIHVPRRDAAEALCRGGKNIIQRQIDATDAEIDYLGYDLYALSEDEIKIVEGENG